MEKVISNVETYTNSSTFKKFKDFIINENVPLTTHKENIKNSIDFLNEDLIVIKNKEKK